MKILVMIDMQNDFLTGALGNAQTAAVLENVCRYVKKYLSESKAPFIYTMDTHQQNYLETYEGHHLPVEHCIENTEGWQLYGKVGELLQDCLCFKKPTFPSLDLAYYLEDKEYKDITLVGVVSHICVLSNAIMAKAAQPDTPIRVDLRGTSSGDEKVHHESIDVMKSMQIEIIE